MIDLSVVILSFNTKELLRECLKSIFVSAGVDTKTPRGCSLEIIVADNASGDESAGMVREEFKDVSLIANSENVGYAKGNNQGVNIAEGRYILFLNADTVVYKDTLKTMVAFMDEHKDVGAATCRVELPNGKLDDSCHRGFPTPWRSFSYFAGFSKLFPKVAFFAGYNLTHLDITTIHEIDSCSGAFMIVRREAGEEVGWWDEDFFWYGDDLDFCYRLKEKGWKVYFVPTVKILHYKGVSGGIKEISKHLTVATRETVIRATNARFDAMRKFYKKHYINKYPAIITWLVLGGINLKHWVTLRSLQG